MRVSARVYDVKGGAIFSKNNFFGTTHGDAWTPRLRSPSLIMAPDNNRKVEKIRKILSYWKYRRLTLLGKITVLKSLASSQLVYLPSPLPSNYNALNQINKLFYQFLWNGKGDKIKRKIMINDYFDGGLKMIDLISFNKALKTTWIKKYLDTTKNAKWIFFF